jgi:uncharacterized cupin superfamily protein
MGLAHWDEVERYHVAQRGSVPHCHSEEEEVFVILEGEGTLHLWPSPSFAAATGAEQEEIPIRPGHVIARPPATRVSHSFRAGANGMTRRIEVLEYDEGEPDD